MHSNGHWYYIDNKWQWHPGNACAYTDAHKNYHSLTGKYTGLLQAERLGSNAKGARTYRLTLYHQKQVVATGTGFSGGQDEAGKMHHPVRDGNYQIQTKHDPVTPTAPAPGDPDNNPPVSYSVQRIDRTVNPYTEAVYQAYGPLRARLNPLSGPDVGDYFHGQYNGHGWTHGCLCYGTNTRMIEHIWNKMHHTWVAVSVDVPVVRPNP